MSECPLCKTPELAPGVAGCFHTTAEHIQIKAIRDAEVDARRRHEAYLGSLPQMYRDYLDAIPAGLQRANRDLITHARTLSRHSFLYLHGPGGSGKTHLAVRAGARLVKEGASALYANEAHFYRAVETEREGGRKAPDLMRPQVLVYDDVGFKAASPATLQRFYEVLEYRWSNRMATFITANRPPEEVASVLAQDDGRASAILSRLRAGRVFEVVRTIDGREGGLA